MTGAHVLLVEDENIIAGAIRGELQSLGYTVSGTASSGEEAVAKAADTRPDIVLMDIVLKGNMDGIEAARHVREQFDIPVVFLTAYADDETLRRARTTQPFGHTRSRNCTPPSRWRSSSTGQNNA
jgi:CheY-like chemotaxis protein